MKKSFLIIIIIILIGVVVWGTFFYLNKRNAVSFITIDINPSVELALNEKNQVIEVLPLNEDADVILSGLKLIGLSIEEASEQIIKAASETGYIEDLSDNNNVIITSTSNDEKIRLYVEKKVIDKLNAYFEKKKIYALVVAKGLSDELKDEANSYEITYGKMLLVERTISLNPTLNKDDLAKMSIKDIQNIIRKHVKNRHDDMKIKKEEAMEKWENQKIIRIGEYNLKLQQQKEELWEANKDKYINTTTVEKNRIINDLIEQRQTQIKSDLDNFKNELKQERQEIKNDTYNYPVLEEKYEEVKREIQQRRSNNQ